MYNTYCSNQGNKTKFEVISLFLPLEQIEDIKVGLYDYFVMRYW